MTDNNPNSSSSGSSSYSNGASSSGASSSNSASSSGAPTFNHGINFAALVGSGNRRALFDSSLAREKMTVYQAGRVAERGRVAPQREGVRNLSKNLSSTARYLGRVQADAVYAVAKKRGLRKAVDVELEVAEQYADEVNSITVQDIVASMHQQMSQPAFQPPPPPVRRAKPAAPARLPAPSRPARPPRPSPQVVAAFMQSSSSSSAAAASSSAASQPPANAPSSSSSAAAIPALEPATSSSSAAASSSGAPRTASKSKHRSRKSSGKKQPALIAKVDHARPRTVDPAALIDAQTCVAVLQPFEGKADICGFGTDCDGHGAFVEPHAAFQVDASKKCTHRFHLSCLKGWIAQNWMNNQAIVACRDCRRPWFDLNRPGVLLGPFEPKEAAPMPSSNSPDLTGLRINSPSDMEDVAEA